MARIVKQKRGKYDYDIFIVGGGTAGVRAAEIMAAEGKRVGLADPHDLGGYEATEGYGERAPLVAAARLYSTIKSAGEVGIRGGSVGYNYPTLREWSKRARGAQSLRLRLETLGVHIYKSAARFVGPHEVSLGRQHVTSSQFLISTGSSLSIPSTIVGLDSVKYLTPLSATDLLKPPKSLFIIGGGKTGIELAGLFTSFGTTVYIAEIAPRLLPDEDSDVGEALKRELESRGSEVLTSTRVTVVSKETLVHRITYLRGDVEHVVKAEHILIAGGRTPNLDLGLENAEVDYTPIGVTVGASLQTSVKHIYAAGSITGNVSGVEGARYEAGVAAHNLISRTPLTGTYTAIPVSTFSQPEVARVGVNEGEALRKDISAHTSVVQLSETAAGRAGRHDGYVKLVTDRKGIVIGATIVANGASDVINTLTLAVQSGLNVQTLVETPFVYGSIGEAVMLAAQKSVK